MTPPQVAFLRWKDMSVSFYWRKTDDAVIVRMEKADKPGFLTNQMLKTEARILWANLLLQGYEHIK